MYCGQTPKWTKLIFGVRVTLLYMDMPICPQKWRPPHRWDVNTIFGSCYAIIGHTISYFALVVKFWDTLSWEQLLRFLDNLDQYFTWRYTHWDIPLNCLSFVLFDVVNVKIDRTIFCVSLFQTSLASWRMALPECARMYKQTDGKHQNTVPLAQWWI